MKRLKTSDYVEGCVQTLKATRALEAQARSAMRRVGRTHELLEAKKFLRERRKSLEIMISHLGRV